jgi:hypothetical protein
MNAWLITWEWKGEHAKRENPLIAIFSYRKGENFVRKFVEEIYLMKTSTVEKKVHWANRSKARPYKAKKEIIAKNDVPHDMGIICGHNPFIYARKVSDLKVVRDPENEVEELSWKESPTYRWKNREEWETEVAEEGRPKMLKVKMK